MSETQWQWWGRIDAVLHRFEGWTMEGHAPIRTSPTAACGWVPPCDVMEGFETPGEEMAKRLCFQCSAACTVCYRYFEDCLCGHRVQR